MPTTTPSPSSNQPPPLTYTPLTSHPPTQTNRPNNSTCRRKLDRDTSGREVARLLHLRHQLLKEARERGHGVVDGGVEMEGTVVENPQEKIGRENEGLVKQGEEAASPWTIGKAEVEELLGMVGSDSSSRGNCFSGAEGDGSRADDEGVASREGSGGTVVHVPKNEEETSAEKVGKVGKVGGGGTEDPYLELMQHAVFRGEQRRGERRPTRRYRQRDGSVRFSFEGHLGEGRIRG